MFERRLVSIPSLTILKLKATVGKARNILRQKKMCFSVLAGVYFC